MYNKKPRGYFERILVMDSETSGIGFNHVDPSLDLKTGKTYQAVSWGLIVADAKTLKPIDKLYVEIKHNGESLWSDEAEKVHGLSKEYLEKNGLDEDEAASEILSFVHHHMGVGADPSILVPCAGHNVSSFDIHFMRRLLVPHELMFKTGNRFIDTNSIGFVCYETFNSEDLFNQMGIVRGNHNALDDAYASLKVLQVTRKMCQQFLEEH